MRHAADGSGGGPEKLVIPVLLAALVTIRGPAMAFSYTDFRVVDIGISSAHFICHFLQDRVKATLRREDGDFNGGKKALSATTYVF